MKKVKSLLLAALAVATVFTSCKKDEDAVAPEIQFIEDGRSDKVIAQDSTVSFSFMVKEGSEKLEESGINVTLKKGTDALTINVVEAEPMDDGFTVAVAHYFGEAGEYMFYIDVADKGTGMDSATVKVTVEAAADTTNNQDTVNNQQPVVVLDMFTGIKVASSLADGSAKGDYASVDGTTYSYNEVKASTTIQAKIDFAYYYQSSATLAQPAAVPTAFGDPTNLTTKNDTKFVLTTLTTAEFDAIEDTDDSVIAAQTPSAASVGSLAAGNVVAFETAAGKKGLLKVTEVKGTYDSGDYIMFDVKVQK